MSCYLVDLFTTAILSLMLSLDARQIQVPKWGSVEATYFSWDGAIMNTRQKSISDPHRSLQFYSTKTDEHFHHRTIFDPRRNVLLDSNITDEHEVNNTRSAFHRARTQIDNLSVGLADNCNERYGNKMLTTSRPVEVCRGTGVNATARAEHSNSSVECLQRVPFDVGGNQGRYFCTFYNVEMVAKRREFAAWNCTIDEPLRANQRWGWYEKDAVETLALHPHPGCKAIVKHPVFVFPSWTKGGAANFYEWFHEYLVLFESLAMLNLDPTEVELWIPNVIGHEVTAPHFEFIVRLFRGYPIRYATQPWPVGTCFQQVSLPPSPGVSTITAFGGRAGHIPSCRSPVLLGVRSFTLDVFPEADSMIESPDFITMLERSPKVSRSKLPRQRQGHDIVAELRKRMTTQESRKYEIIDYDPVNKSISTGLHIMVRTKMLVGIHGAGLTHAFFLPSEGMLLELFCDDRDSRNGHYKTIATLRGLKYLIMQKRRCVDYTAKEVADVVWKSVYPDGSHVKQPSQSDPDFWQYVFPKPDSRADPDYWKFVYPRIGQSERLARPRRLLKREGSGS